MRNRWHKSWGRFKGISDNAVMYKRTKPKVRGKLLKWEREEIALQRLKNKIPIETTIQKIQRLQKAQAILFLRELSDKKYRCIVPLYLRRKEFDNNKWKFYKRWKGSKCIACKITSISLLHHITMLKNGGTNDFDNIVGLCRECHGLIHDWLKPLHFQYGSTENLLKII